MDERQMVERFVECQWWMERQQKQRNTERGERDRPPSIQVCNRSPANRAAGERDQQQRDDRPSAQRVQRRKREQRLRPQREAERATKRQRFIAAERERPRSRG